MVSVSSTIQESAPCSGSAMIASPSNRRNFSGSGSPVRAHFISIFFFQAEDGIRDGHVTGVQTCALPISWVEIIRRLGYDRYVAAGNDAGSMISPEIGRLAPEHVMGVHVTQLFSFPTGNPDEFAGLSDADQAALKHLQWFYSTMFSFNSLHSQQPQTLAFALADSPVGLLAWNAQLFGYSLDPEFIIANVAIYWFTRTAGSAIRLYYEDAHNNERPTG